MVECRLFQAQHRDKDSMDAIPNAAGPKFQLTIDYNCFNKSQFKHGNRQKEKNAFYFAKNLSACETKICVRRSLAQPRPTKSTNP